jgi:hypothetical protein
VTLAPSDGTAWDEEFHNIIFERNWYTGSSNCCWPMLAIQAQDVTVRNEIFNLTGAGGAHWAIDVGGASTKSPGSNNVRLFNNTLFSNDTSDPVDTGIVKISGTPTGVTAKNNLGYTPHSAATFNIGNVAGSNNATAMNTDPRFAVVPPSAPGDFKITQGSYAIGAGTVVPVWSDFFLVPQSTSRDMGAIIH